MTEEAVFAAALDKPTPDARRAYLDQVCANDPELRRRVEALLRSHDDAGSFLRDPAAVQAALAGPDTPASAHPTPVGALTQAEDEHAVPDLSFLKPSATAESLGRLDHYEILEVIGQGGFGVVLKARDTALDRIVAVKVVTGPMAALGTARRRFEREAKAAAAVIHDNVVTIHHVESKDVPYLVMQYIHGATLQHKLDRHGPLELKEILRIGMQTARGLAAAHAQGIVIATSNRPTFCSKTASSASSSPISDWPARWTPPA